MKSYFFVPAGKLAKLEAIRQLGPDEIIVDFEDAAIGSTRSAGVDYLSTVDHFEKLWVRAPLRDGWDEPLSTALLERLLDSGVKRFVLPKLRSPQEWVAVANLLGNVDEAEAILLFEHPYAVIHMTDFFDARVPVRLTGAGIGSHDITTIIGGTHSLRNVDLPRSALLYHCRAYEAEAIDVASMGIGDPDSYREEVVDGIERGFDAKFLIHPRQLAWLREESGVDRSLTWALRVIDALPEGALDEDIEPFVLDGVVIERPHVIQARNIMNEVQRDVE